MKRHRVYLGLGSNLGDREQTIRRAIGLIGERVGTVIRESSLIETEPWGFESENKFLNGAILCETTLTPHEVLEATQQIERKLGKEQKHATMRSQRSVPNVPLELRSLALAEPQERSTCNVQRSTYHDRPIDIDILLYDDVTLDEPDLHIPHPRMLERDFVMIPLNELRAADD